MARACRRILLASTAILCAIATSARAQSRQFDIPAQPAETGISAFGTQAGIQIIAARTFTRGKRTQSVRGTLPVEAALRQLLAGTGLIAQSTGPQTFIIVPPPQPTLPAPTLAGGGCPSPIGTRRRDTESRCANHGPDPDKLAPELLADAPRDVVITARRQAIETASTMKRQSDTLIDAVVADEAGKLPDNSLTEVLQRVPGVTITRFASVGDPDHYSAEGFGIQVRGLSGVAARLNGREIFSAATGRGLSWADITPELMSAVVVYKASTADLIRGGTGGQLDLRTKMPFDYDGFTLQASGGEDYGDLSQKARFGGSLFVADRIVSPIGDIGIVADFARSKYVQRTNFVRAEPYYRTSIDGSDRYIPGGYDYGEDNYSRTRTGLYGALQWAPSDRLQISAIYFDSRYRDSTIGPIAYVQSQTLAVDPASSVFDAHGGLVRSSDVFSYDPTTFLPSSAPIAAGGSTNFASGQSRTRDISVPVLWQPAAGVAISGAYQDVRSTASNRSYALFESVNFPTSFGIDLSGKLPQVSFPKAGSVSVDPADYFWLSSMDHLIGNSGHQRAANVDVDFSWSDHSFFRSAKAGIRLSDRIERDGDSPYNWQAFGQTWNGFEPVSFAASNPRDYSEFAFRDFFRGDANLPARLLLPSVAAVERFDPAGDHLAYGNPITPITLTPGSLSKVETRSLEAYLLTRFAQDDSPLGPLSGNLGLRLVSGRNRSSGFFQENAAQYVRAGALQTIVSTVAPREGGRSYARLLPVVNLQVLPAPDLHLRFAYSETMDDPRYDALRPGGTLTVQVVGGTADAPGTFDGFVATLGNPRLKPVTARNIDAAIEYYPSAGTALHATVFHKIVHNALIYGAIEQTVPIVYADGTTRNETALTNNYVNAGVPARIEGIELGARSFLDRLPGFLSGFGMEADYTLIDSHNPGDTYRDINGQVHDDVPFEGLSRHNLNLVALYEHGAVSARIAYSWRSRYLLYTNSSGTNGSYNYYSAPGAAPQPIDISLPVYSEAYGQVDAGVTLRLTKNVSLSVQGGNLLNTIAKTSMGGYPGGVRYIRSWFIADRRIRGSIDLAF